MCYRLEKPPQLSTQPRRITSVGFRYSAAVARVASHASISESFQRVQPGVSITGLGNIGSVLTHRHGVERWTP